MKTLNRLSYIFYIFLVIAPLIILLARPQIITSWVIKGISLSVYVLIPTLFPFLILTELIIKSGIFEFLSAPFRFISKLLFLPPKAGAAIAMSFLGGYPVGAAGIDALIKNGHLSKRQAEHMLCFCINASPAFLIGTLGSILKSAHFGLILFISQLCSSFVIAIFSGLVFRHIKTSSIFSYTSLNKNNTAANLTISKPQGRTDLSSDFVASVVAASKNMINIISFVVAFSAIVAITSELHIVDFLSNILSGLFSATNLTGDFFKSAIIGSIEVTLGSSLAANIGGSGLFLAAGLASFGGLSVYFQIRAILFSHSLSFKPYFISRLFATLLTVVFSILGLRLFPLALNTFKNSVDITLDFITPIPALFFLVLTCCILIYKIDNFFITKEKK